MIWTGRPNSWPAHRVQYLPCAGCGSHCSRASEATPEQPCWGRVLFEILPATPTCAAPSWHACGGHGTPGTYVPLRMAPDDKRAGRPPIARREASLE